MKSPTSILWNLWDKEKILYPTQLGVQHYAQSFEISETMIQTLAMRRYLRKGMEAFVQHYRWTPSAVVDLLRSELIEIEQGKPSYLVQEIKP